MKKIILLSLIFLLMLSFVSAQGTDEKFKVIVMSSASCPHCAKLKAHLNSLMQQHPNKIELIEWTFSQNMDEIMEIQKKFGVPLEQQGWVPKAFLENDYCVGDTPCIELINEKFQEFLEQEPPPHNGDQNNVVPPNGNGKNGSNGNGQKLTEINVWQLMGLAAVDAVNPCELAVLVILMTAILSRFPNQKKKALKAGLAFSLAIFLMYLIFGLLIIFGFKFLMGFSQINTTIFYTILGVIAIILGILNIKDAIWYGGGGFIMEVPQKWRPKMKGIIKGTTSTKGAFIVGLIVSFFLTPCTAGPYFVAGGILSQISLLAALPLLLLYMILFISPMIAITLITYFGFMAVEDISGWREKNIKKLHWIAGLILLGLGLAMVFGLI